MSSYHREIRTSLQGLSAFPSGKRAREPLDPVSRRLVLDLLEAVPEVRAEKVISLKQAVKESRYRVPSGELAERLIARMLADNKS